jgi:hypothetical protein
MGDLPANRGAHKPPKVHTDAEIDAFIDRLREHAASVRGRLIFALDATQSRQPTWDTASKLQSDMFREVATIGGLEVQLVYYRGSSECKASRWVLKPDHLTRIMESIMCRTGPTQIGKVLAHVRRENASRKVSALVFVGDAMEENASELYAVARELGVPALMFQEFQEGVAPEVEKVYREIVRLTRGAYCRFDTGAAQQLRELLRAAAVFAAGGVQALADRKDAGATKLLGQLRGDRS